MKKQHHLQEEIERLNTDGKGGHELELQLLKDESDILEKQKVLMDKIIQLIADGITGAEKERLMDQLK